MSKFVKDLEMQHLRRQFDGVSDVVVVNVVGMGAVESTQLRNELRKKGIHLQVVKNSLAKRVFDELGLSPVNSLLEGPSAVAWGGAGIVELAKEITEWAKKLKKLDVRGGAVSGQTVDAAGVETLSKLPNREELIGRVIQLVNSPGARLAALLAGPGSLLASQIKEIAEKQGESAGAAEAGETAPAVQA